MHPPEPSLLVFAALGLLFLAFKSLSDRKCYATLLEKSVIHDGVDQSVTRFVCVFWLHTGLIVTREVDHSFFNQIPIGEIGVVYHRGTQVTGLCFHSRR